MARIRPKKWDNFQHYKDRSPSWIKLHKNLLDDYDFQCLPLASRALAPMLWLVASEDKDGWIDANEKKLAFRLRVDAEELRAALKSLIEAGFFDVEHDASSSLAETEHDASPEKENKKQVTSKTETEKKVCAPPSAAPPQLKTTRRQIPDNFPEKSDLDWARKHWLKKGRADLCEQIEDELAKFRDHHVSHQTRSADWSASWRTWVRNAMNFSRKNRNGTGSQANGKSALETKLAATEAAVRALERADDGSSVCDGADARDDPGAGFGSRGTRDVEGFARASSASHGAGNPGSL